ncbi:MAG: SEC-C metal-binding domain-containing protein, partial [Thermodesulfobacteriota bacterium]
FIRLPIKFSDEPLLKNAKKLIERVKNIDKEIIRNARDPKNWGMAKSFVMAANKMGVDITNEKEMNKFIGLYNFYNFLLKESKNNNMFNSPTKEEKQKIGRNEPCPYGSGKKYKKCCGR